MAKSETKSFQVDVTLEAGKETKAEPVSPSPVAPEEKAEQPVSQTLQRSGPSLNEMTQSAASAAGTPVADALKAVHGQMVINTPSGQQTVDTPASVARGVAQQSVQPVSGEGDE